MWQIRVSRMLLSTEFGAYAVEMEGAAIAQAAYLNNVPFLVVRAISDKADGSAEVDYPTFEAHWQQSTVSNMTLRILKDDSGLICRHTNCTLRLRCIECYR